MDKEAIVTLCYVLGAIALFLAVSNFIGGVSMFATGKASSQLSSTDQIAITQMAIGIAQALFGLTSIAVGFFLGKAQGNSDTSD